MSRRSARLRVASAALGVAPATHALHPHRAVLRGIETALSRGAKRVDVLKEASDLSNKEGLGFADISVRTSAGSFDAGRLTLPCSCDAVRRACLRACRQGGAHAFARRRPSPHPLLTLLPSPPARAQYSEEAFRRDVRSHHILRLAYANTEEKRRWFVQHESLLLQARLRRETSEGVTAFMARHNFSLTPVEEEEVRALEKELRCVWDATWQGRAEADGFGGAAAGGAGAPPDAAEEQEKFEATTFFKVPFTQAMELVRGRRVLLRGGLAYVPRGRLTAIVVNRFAAYLRMMLAHSNRALPEALQDERLKPMLEHLSTAYVGPEFGAKRAGDKVSPAEVDALAAPGPAGAFPLCMQASHDALRRDAHLKHGARMQYGLFLKGIGLSMEDALAFWQKSFSKSFTPDEFLKKYAYNIRHNYGKEGNRKDYTAYSCGKIIQAAPAPGDAHGCPFKAWEPGSLRAELAGRMRLAPAAVEDIMAAVRSKDYQIACQKQFAARYPGAELGPVGNHPNSYFETAHGFLKSTGLVGPDASAKPAASAPPAWSAKTGGGGGGGAGAGSPGAAAAGAAGGSPAGAESAGAAMAVV